MIRELRNRASRIAERNPCVKSILVPLRVTESKILNGLSVVLSGEQYLKLMYRRGFGKPLNLENPQAFSEKIQWLKLYDRNPLIPICADKLEVRDFVAKHIGVKYLIPILFNGPLPEAIPFARLPTQYIIKTNHGSGTNIVVLGGQMVLNKKEQPFNMERIVSQIRKWLKTDYSKIRFEWQYRHIKSQVFVEQLKE